MSPPPLLRAAGGGGLQALSHPRCLSFPSITGSPDPLPSLRCSRGGGRGCFASASIGSFWKMGTVAPRPEDTGWEDFLALRKESTGCSAPSSQEWWRWGVHTQHPHGTRVTRRERSNGDAGLRSSAGVDFVGFLGLMSQTPVLLRVSGVDHSRRLAQPLSFEGEFLCLTPAETCFSAGPWRLYPRHLRCRHPCPAFADLHCGVLVGPADRPLDVAALPQPGCLLGRVELRRRRHGL